MTIATINKLRLAGNNGLTLQVLNQRTAIFTHVKLFVSDCFSMNFGNLKWVSKLDILVSN